MSRHQPQTHRCCPAVFQESPKALRSGFHLTSSALCCSFFCLPQTLRYSPNIFFFTTVNKQQTAKKRPAHNNIARNQQRRRRRGGDFKKMNIKFKAWLFMLTSAVAGVQFVYSIQFSVGAPLFHSQLKVAKPALSLTLSHTTLPFSLFLKKYINTPPHHSPLLLSQSLLFPHTPFFFHDTKNRLIDLI